MQGSNLFKVPVLLLGGPSVLEPWSLGVSLELFTSHQIAFSPASLSVTRPQAQKVDLWLWAHTWEGLNAPDRTISTSFFRVKGIHFT